jgi:hypothetical protein
MHFDVFVVATYLGPGLACGLGLCSHGALQLHRESDVLAALVRSKVANVLNDLVMKSGQRHA